MINYIFGAISGIGLTILAAALFSPKTEDLNDKWGLMNE